MSFQKHLLLRLSVDKLGATYEETPSTKPTDLAQTQLPAEVRAPTALPFSQRMGAVLRALLKQSCPSYFGRIKAGKASGS
ncbi:MAG: hypothetical protein U0350_46385 [Caldilineaceae bacterium]